MSSLVSGLDTHMALQVGENEHTELSYSNELDEKIIQFFFQLVRCEDHSILESIQQDILYSIKGDLVKNYSQIEMMYKLIGQTRDIISGKGEQKLAFMQIWGFYRTGYHELALSALTHFVNHVDLEHPFGSWKDIKYFCQYIYDKTQNTEHPLILNAISLIITQLTIDWQQYNTSQEKNGSTSHIICENDTAPRFSLAGRWCPRGKSQHKWLHNKIASTMFNQYIVTARTAESKKRALIKCRAQLSKIITTLNKVLQTTQIYQCGNDWKNIEFNKVTSATMRKQSRAFANVTKKGESRSMEVDRLTCANNLKAHFDLCKKNPAENKIHGRRLNVYELVKDAYQVDIGDSCAQSPEEDRINLQWEDNRKNNMGLGAFIPVSDTSFSMTEDKSIPLFSSIGLGIRCSEITHPAFRHRVMSFADIPVWHNLEDCDTFIDKVKKIRSIHTGLGTNFYRALKMVLDVIIENQIPPKDVENLVLGIFSDMQINEAIENCGSTHMDQLIFSNESNYMDTMFMNIKKMYAEAGLRSKFNKPYNPPHILFWNLRSTKGFPVTSSQKNVTMLSGYSSTLLNTLCDKGIDALKELTPRSMLKDILNNERYNIMRIDVREWIADHYLPKANA